MIQPIAFSGAQTSEEKNERIMDEVDRLLVEMKDIIG